MVNLPMQIHARENTARETDDTTLGNSSTKASQMVHGPWGDPSTKSSPILSATAQYGSCYCCRLLVGVRKVYPLLPLKYHHVNSHQLQYCDLNCHRLQYYQRKYCELNCHRLQ